MTNANPKQETTKEIAKRKLSDEDYRLMCRYDDFNLLSDSASEQIIEAGRAARAVHPHRKLGGVDILSMLVNQEVRKQNVPYITQLVFEFRERIYELQKELLDERGEWDELLQRKERHEKESDWE